MPKPMQPKCPQCGSSEFDIDECTGTISPEGATKGVNVPGFFHIIYCKACGHIIAAGSSD